MLVVETDTLKVRFGFFHQVQDTEETAAHTKCTLEVTDKATKKVFVSVAYAQCHEKDQFNKEIGRKISLERALHNAFPSEADDMDVITKDAEYNRMVRAQVWDRYFNRALGNKEYEAMLKAFDEAEEAGARIDG